jgi:glucokinase
MIAHTLLADIGGTNVRFALAEPGGRPQAIEKLQTASFADFPTAIRHYLSAHGRPTLDAAAVCAAGPVIDNAVRMTNCPWLVSLDEVRQASNATRAFLLNDFEAVSMSLPALGDADLRKIGGGSPMPGFPCAVLGPGTGLGVGGLVADRHRGHVAIASEGGHADLAPSNERELAILKHLIDQHGHVSAERVLSGPGLCVLFDTIAALDDRKLQTPLPQEIAAQAGDGSCPISREAVALFTGWLGAFAGDLALTLGARGGVYLAGGIIREWGDLFDEGLFRRRFEAKGRFRDYLAPIPTYIVTARHVALIGLSQMVAEA